VGFISDLPTMLVAAFRATLEDVIEADVLLHVRDVSHGETEAQASDVQGVLRDLGIDPETEHRIIEVWNKADLLAPEERERLANQANLAPPERRPVLVSAVTGHGVEDLLAAIEGHVSRGRATYAVELDSADGGGLHWLYEQAEVLDRHEEGTRITLRARVAPEKEARLLNRFPSARREVE
jgi:GTP-binding protein HflX